MLRSHSSSGDYFFCLTVLIRVFLWFLWASPKAAGTTTSFSAVFGVKPAFPSCERASSRQAGHLRWCFFFTSVAEAAEGQGAQGPRGGSGPELKGLTSVSRLFAKLFTTFRALG